MLKHKRLCFCDEGHISSLEVSLDWDGIRGGWGGGRFNEEDGNFVFSLYSAACFCVKLN
jgi:hypothetical protein